MFIYEAAQKALSEIGRPAHVKEILDHIVRNAYFSFGAADALRALGVQLDRHARGVQISKPATPTVFYRDRPATYGLLEWLNAQQEDDLLLDEQISEAAYESLDDTLVLEQELHNWLFRSWQRSQLAELGFGPLALFDAAQQMDKRGKYNTRVVGEIDFLFTTGAGEFVVCELKRASDDQTVGQLCRYWGWVNANLANGKRVHGLVLAREVSDSLKYAIQATAPDIKYRELRLDISLGPTKR